jgi:branched-chain amino acid transport system ATP-binding protein
MNQTRGGSDDLLEVSNLTKEFGGLTAVDDISFSIQVNDICGFIGPNGAGKTTTFDCIMGKHQLSEGTIRFHDENITGLPTYKIVNRGISRTFQQFNPMPDRTVLENVLLSLFPNKIFARSSVSSDYEQQARSICKRVQLEHSLNSYPDELPHEGMIKLELGRVLANNPKLILLDEPFSGLTSNEINNFSKILTNLHEEGTTFVVIDHNMRGLFSLIEKVIVLNNGSVIAEGAPEEVRSDPIVQDAYLGGEINENA